MRKFTTVLAAMLLALSMMAMPAMADETVDALEQAVIDAQAEVDRLETKVSGLEDDIVEAEQAVADQQGIVDDLEAELEEAQAALKEASDDLAALIETRDACEELATNQLRNACRNPTNPEYNKLHDDVVPALQASEAEALEAFEAADLVLDGLKEELQELEDNKALTEADLDAARQALIDAEAALAAASSTHPGCTGINNAKANVAKNVPIKSKAPAALEAVSQKLGC
jgi:chromosome segregation ATPase